MSESRRGACRTELWRQAFNFPPRPRKRAPLPIKFKFTRATRGGLRPLAILRFTVSSDAGTIDGRPQGLLTGMTRASHGFPLRIFRLGRLRPLAVLGFTVSSDAGTIHGRPQGLVTDAPNGLSRAPPRAWRGRPQGLWRALPGPGRGASKSFLPGEVSEKGRLQKLFSGGGRRKSMSRGASKSFFPGEVAENGSKGRLQELSSGV